jgi:hypothetical protein
MDVRDICPTHAGNLPIDFYQQLKFTLHNNKRIRKIDTFTHTQLKMHEILWTWRDSNPGCLQCDFDRVAVLWIHGLHMVVLHPYYPHIWGVGSPYCTFFPCRPPALHTVAHGMKKEMQTRLCPDASTPILIVGLP